MRNGGGFRVLAAILLLGFVGLITAGAYGAGFAAGSASGTTNVPAWAYGGAFGAGHVFGFLITILVLIIVFRLILLAIFGGRRHGPWGYRGYWHGDGDPSRFGPGPDAGSGPWQGGWHRSEWRQAGQAAFDEFHRQAHSAEPPASGGSPSGPAAS